jgi:uncharacterized membrane protein (UPF0127 family)
MYWRKSAIGLFLVTVQSLSIAVASPPATKSSLRLQRIEVSGHGLEVEIADTESARERGLMFRTHLAANRGMLFVYPDAQIRNFWMKNTLIPLDILFFDSARRLINISANTPPCKTVSCPTYASAAPARYVLEIKAGLASRLGLKPGELLTIRR